MVDSEYSYAIISSESGESLYVLARNVAKYFEQYHDDVMDYISTYLPWLRGQTLAPIVNTFGSCD